MTNKEIGDEVKSALALEKYSIPRMRIDLTMDTGFFHAFFVANSSLSQPVKVTPSTYEDTTPVVVVELGSLAAGEVLGVSKIKGTGTLRRI
ncbi:hypothetical protein LTR85_006139 [Meristemomyces frigidus]|nr:hypothetical protein LTR85_006139 [Meristemomyces frigidus]